MKKLVIALLISVSVSVISGFAQSAEEDLSLIHI